MPSDNAGMKITATSLVQSLDPDEIREKLDALEREKQALRVLLRAVQAARAKARPEATPCN